MSCYSLISTNLFEKNPIPLEDQIRKCQGTVHSKKVIKRTLLLVLVQICDKQIKLKKHRKKNIFIFTLKWTRTVTKRFQVQEGDSISLEQPSLFTILILLNHQPLFVKKQFPLKIKLESVKELYTQRK